MKSLHEKRAAAGTTAQGVAVTSNVVVTTMDNISPWSSTVKERGL